MNVRAQKRAAPELKTREQIIDYLLSFDLFKGNEFEGYAYVHEAIGRFLVTVQMTPPATRPGARLLELGANPYFITLLLKRFHRYDLSLANYFGPAEPRDEAEQTIRSERYEETYTFRYAHFNMEVVDFPYPDASFDVVLFCEILEHLTLNPTHVLNEIHRVLRPGGAVLVTTPNMMRWEHLWNLALGRNINDPYSGYGVYGRHNREYTPQEVIRLLEDCGFSIEQARLANVHQGRHVQQILSSVRTHWREHTFVLARADRPRRYRFGPWLYRSTVGMRRVTSHVVTMGENDELHTGLGWYPTEEAPEPLRWTQQSAELFLRAQGGEDAIIAEINSGPREIGPVAVLLRCGKSEQQFALEGDEWQQLRLAITPCEAGAEVPLVIEVDQLRCPQAVGFNQDLRQLGVMVRKVALVISAASE